MSEKHGKKKWLHQKLGLKVIDSHSHYLSYEAIRGWGIQQGQMGKRIQSRTDIKAVDLPKPDEDFAQRWITELDRYGIDRIGMMLGQEVWKEYANAMKRFPNRFYGYANINPKNPKAEELAHHAIHDFGLNGFKLYPVANQFHTYDKAAYKIYQVAYELNVPVLHHFGVSIGHGVDLRYGNPLDLQPAARDFPEVKFGIAHMGAGMFRETLLLFYQTDN
ncbi:MAG: amidohydrolase family protein, partial [Promethearchaeota archaeon]